MDAIGRFRFLDHHDNFIGKDDPPSYDEIEGLSTQKKFRTLKKIYAKNPKNSEKNPKNPKNSEETKSKIHEKEKNQIFFLQ